MARNKIDANKSAFAKLYALAESPSDAERAASQARWIKSTSEEERLWLKDVKFTAIEAIGPRLKFIAVRFEGKEYFLVLGSGSTLHFRDTLISETANAGLITAALAELSPPLRSTATWLLVQEMILAQSANENGYDGHDLQEVLSFFEPIQFYQIDANAPFSASQLFRVITFWALNSNELVLPFSKESKGDFLKLVLEGQNGIPFDNVANALFSAHWRHCFLELYRCVEALYAFPRLEGLHRELVLTIPLSNFIKKIEDSCGWWPNEEEALTKLCEFCDDTMKVRLESHLTIKGEKKSAKWLYRLRNAVVHFRPATEQVRLEDSEWDSVSRATLLLVDVVYSKFKTHLQ